MPYIIAEIGNNHDGNQDLALTLVGEAIRCGVDCVKMQLFRADQLVRRDAPAVPHAGDDRTQWERIRALELPFWVYESASNMCHGAGKHFMVSAFDRESMLSVYPICDKIKVASGDLTHQPVLRAAADTGKPVVLSTGMAELVEIAKAIHICNPETVMHCVSLYPCPPDKANLGRIRYLMAYFSSRKIGYSDHCIGFVACLVASAMGADVIEKHFTGSYSSKSADASHSADIQEMQAIVDWCNDADLMMKKCHALTDVESRAWMRRGEDGLRGNYI